MNKINTTGIITCYGLSEQLINVEFMVIVINIITLLLFNVICIIILCDSIILVLFIF